MKSFFSLLLAKILEPLPLPLPLPLPKKIGCLENSVFPYTCSTPLLPVLWRNMHCMLIRIHLARDGSRSRSENDYRFGLRLQSHKIFENQILPSFEAENAMFPSSSAWICFTRIQVKKMNSDPDPQHPPPHQKSSTEKFELINSQYQIAVV